MFFHILWMTVFFLIVQTRAGEVPGLILGSTFCVPQTVRRAVGSSWAILTVPLSHSLYMEEVKDQEVDKKTIRT